ncbi:hypothetical protein [Nakamurella aerolata]|uniref:Uncharacterized protein n=1 Tax=Nakamurella aerolata TaxID=1656892 RepID=A0A849A7C7_9ACTN|nr:hypothetical protein [Nakamurella aerolata]NNG36874.1 hypothetical protein [Nakamurella aerolata]
MRALKPWAQGQQAHKGNIPLGTEVSVLSGPAAVTSRQHPAGHGGVAATF